MFKNNELISFFKGDYDFSSIENDFLINELSYDRTHNIGTFSNIDFYTNSYPKTNKILFIADVQSYQQSYYLIDVPEYYNYSLSPIPDGCSPTSGVMLMSYINNYFINGFNIYDTFMPLNHFDNLDLVNSKIVEMSEYMMTNDIVDGTIFDVFGLNVFLNDNPLIQDDEYFYVYRYSSFDEFKFAIYNGNLPSIITLRNPWHTVLGFGYSNFDGKEFVMTKYTWNDPDYKGTYFIERTRCLNYATLINYNSIL